VTLPPIVRIGDIHDRLDQIVLCDVRWYLDGRSGEAAYLAGHIPGAIFIDLETDLSDPAAPARGRHPWPSPASFAVRLGALGISRTDPVVAYDDGGGTSAGRLVWMLRAIGHDAALLDGGLLSWTDELEASPAGRSPVDYPEVQWPKELFVDADGAGAAGAQAGDRNGPRRAGRSVIDVRSPKRYRGESEPMDPRAGHIPGAANLPLSGNTDTSGFFLERAALRERFAAAGVDEEHSTIVYCGSGVSACQTLLAMEHCGAGRHRLFPGSWSQWSRETDRPVATGKG